MNGQPTAGDRVRLTTRDFEPDYRLGDKATVLSGPHPIPSGGFFYVVTMDRDGLAGTGITINASEIELDAAASVGG